MSNSMLNVMVMEDFVEPRVRKETQHSKGVRVLKDSLNTVVVKEKPEPKIKERAFIRGKFQVFLLVRSLDVIFIFDDPRCDELDLKPVALQGLKGGFTGRVRRIGVVEGEIRSGAPIYRISKDAIALERLKGNMKIQ